MAIKPSDKQGARYRRVSLEMYADARFRALSPSAPSGQSLWTYLLTGPLTTLIPGILVTGEAALAERLRWPLEDFRRCFKEITDQGMAHADWDGPLIFIPNAMKHNPPQSPSVVKGWRQTWAEVPACALKAVAAARIRLALLSPKNGEPYAEAFDEISGYPPPQDVPQPVNVEPPQVVEQLLPQVGPQIPPQIPPHQDQEQEQDQEHTPKPPPVEGAERVRGPRRAHPLDGPAIVDAASLEAFERLSAIYPRPDARVAALRAWHELHPSPELAAVIIEHVLDRLRRGWATDTEPRYLPLLRTFLEERRWQERYEPRKAPPPPKTGAPDGSIRVRTCPDCGAPQEGRMVAGAPVYPPCACAAIARAP